jgi:hypothetical protein
MGAQFAPRFARFRPPASTPVATLPGSAGPPLRARYARMAGCTGQGLLSVAVRGRGPERPERPLRGPSSGKGAVARV